MKNKFATGKRVRVLIMTLVSFVILFTCTPRVYASAEKPVRANAEETGAPDKVNAETVDVAGEKIAEIIVAEDGEAADKRLMKVFPLSADTVTQIPRYIVEENITYVLDEPSILLEETGQGSSEGADVVTVSRKMENLPDNDLERIDKEILHEGIECVLLSVVYEVEKEDKYGIPTEYSAVCEYGGLKKYSHSYPTAWQATVWYDVCAAADGEGMVTTQEEYAYLYVPVERKTGTAVEEKEGKEGLESAEEEEITLPKPEIRKFKVKQVPEEEYKKKVLDILLPVAVAAVGTGAALPFLIWFTRMTVPVFTLKRGKRYRYIGHARIKMEEEMYTAYLTERLLSRAEVPVFMIKLPKKVRKKTRGGMLQIHCPGGKKMLLTSGKEVSFTVEGENV